jgi:hypothetical protein
VPPKPGVMPVGLSLSHPRGLLQDADVAAHRDLAAAAQRVPVDRRDHRLREALDTADHAVPEADERADVRPLEGRAEVRARAEDLVPRPGDDRRAHAVVAFQLGQGRVQLAHERLADRVGGRPVEGDDREALLAGQDQGLVRHRANLLSAGN